jgi:hypothetical protein
MAEKVIWCLNKSREKLENKKRDPKEKIQLFLNSDVTILHGSLTTIDSTKQM